ncbi:unnamed protein product [Mytilus edulis]|uniref:Reverse transcriptase domain-containing protein n=1 Tax=Mytilus edulis TaxID=6550 RepID=A0A8S3UR77_MYTED|nr:unnamed protein product [Mytilus edulis]
MVDELYYVEPEGYDESQGADPEVYDENNNDNNDHVGDTEVAEPPAKKQKTVDKEGDNVFKAAAQAYRSKDNVDTSVDDTLADTVNEFFREGISDEKYNELMKSVARPENCVSLTRTRVNQLIWDLLSPQTRSFDSVIQQHQETVVKASCNITKLLNMLCKLKSELGDDCQQEMQSCIDLGIDSIALLSQYNKMTNIKRKEYQRFDLSPEYHHLSSPQFLFTDMLYGDNVHQKSNEIQDMNRLGRNLNNNNNARGRGNGFSRGGSFGRGRGFGRGRAGSRRGGYRGGRGRGYGGRGQYSNDQGGSKNLRGVPTGRLKNYVENWQKITSDKFILDTVEHCHLEFIDNSIPTQSLTPYQRIFDKGQEKIINDEIENLKKLGVIVEVKFDTDQYISPIFTVPKKNTNEHRVILNLKELNKFIIPHHFKMDTFEMALKLVKPNCFFSSIDLRHAYYSVPIAEEHQKLLRFIWKNTIFQYTCLPNGLLSAPRIFTKLMKPVFATLRQFGYMNVAYIDDSLLLGDTEDECIENVQNTNDLMEWLGFIIHERKSVFKPAKQIVFLGNIIDSVSMTVVLPKEKVEKIVLECQNLIKKNVASIRLVAHVIGLLISTLSAVDFGHLYYRNLEIEKIQALKFSFGNFDQNMTITFAMKADLKWWVENLHCQKRVINRKNPDFSMTTDASLKGWGALFKDQKIQGRWNDVEQTYHINVLELYTCDNSSAIAYVNNMGGIKSKQMNEITKLLWVWCIERNIWISVEHIPGKYNAADVESRKIDDHLEWMLDKQVFHKLVEIWGTPDHDLFASRLNCQVKSFSSWKPDPEAVFVNAFSILWSDEVFYYLFPPFSLISRCLQKVQKDSAEVLMIVPLWPTQAWYPVLLEMLIDFPKMLPRKKRLLSIPGTEKIHPLHNQLKFLACRLSGKIWKTKAFQTRLPKSFWRLGETVRKSNTQLMSSNGSVSVVKGKLIHFNQL